MHYDQCLMTPFPWIIYFISFHEQSQFWNSWLAQTQTATTALPYCYCVCVGGYVSSVLLLSTSIVVPIFIPFLHRHRHRSAAAAVDMLDKEIKMKDGSSTRFFFSFPEPRVGAICSPSPSPSIETYTTDTDTDNSNNNNTVMTSQQEEEQPQEREQQQEESDENTIYHTVEPSDSLRWICLKYKVTAPAIRAANNDDFIGNNLKFAPERLRIPSVAATVITKTGTDGVRRGLINPPRRRRARRAGGLMKMKKKMLSSSRSSVDTNGTTCLQYNVAPETEKKIGNVDNNFLGYDYLAYAADPDRLAIPVTVTIPIPKSATEWELNSARDDEKVESLESQVSKITLSL